MALTGVPGGAGVEARRGGGKYRIAVFPMENLSGTRAPLRELRLELVKRVRAEGFEILDDAALDNFLARHRLRYIGGIDGESAEAFAAEEGVDAVLIPSLEYYMEGFPPKISMTARLVSAEREPRILWMDSVGLSGDDSPGILNLGMVRSAPDLTAKALSRLCASLGAEMAGTAAAEEGSSFAVRKFYRSDLAPSEHFRVVVLPFYNRTTRKWAGEKMALHFIQELRKLGNFEIVEPGVVRRDLLQYRLIMDVGVSSANADVLYDVLQANLIVTGKVYAYEDTEGESGVPKVTFASNMLEKKNHEVVFASDSYNSGNERVHFFNLGRLTTAHDLAIEMVRGVVDKVRGPRAAGQ